MPDSANVTVMRRPQLLQFRIINSVYPLPLPVTFAYSEFAGMSIGDETYVIMRLPRLLNLVVIVAVTVYVYDDEYMRMMP